MKNFIQWYTEHIVEITWFIIGFLIASALDSFSQGRYADSAFSLLLAFANYYVSRD